MPGSPYTDLDRPPLSLRALQRGLVVAGGLWRRIELHAETGSTNADAVAAARAGEPEGLVVVAERQTAGRGRRDRPWSSPARAGLAVSVLLRPGAPDPDRDRPPVPPAALGWLPLLAGVALVEAVTRVAEVPATLKWPNDLLVRADGRWAKCAGILAETVSTGAASAVVVGIGLNVTLRPDELPTGPTGLPATSLQLAGAAVTDRDPLLRATLRSLADWYARWRDAAGDARACGLAEAYARRCGTRGREVRVALPGGVAVTGTASAVDDEGRLVVRTAEGEVPVSAGDVVHLR